MEEIESGVGIFYHNSDYDFNSFNAQIKKDKRTNYLFFSNEPNTFIDRKYTYKVKLQFDPNKIFNTYKYINDYGLKYTLEDYKDEVLDLFEDNLDYFLDEWTRAGVDSINEVMEYYIDIGGDEDDMVGLLYYFLTKWNDSWAIIETDKFLDFIESKGFNGFVTQEEGLTNIACKDFKSIEIIGKKEMWSDEGEGVKSLKENNDKKPNFVQVYIDENGFNSALKEFGSIELIAKKLNLTPEKLLEKYNPFEDIFSDEEFKTELKNSISHIEVRPTSKKRFKENTLEKNIDMVIGMTIDQFHSDLINWDIPPYDWKVPQTPELLAIIYKDSILNNNIFKRLSLDKNSKLNENNDKFKNKVQDTINQEGIFFAIDFFGGIEKLSKKLNKKPIEITRDYFLDKKYSINDFDIKTGGYDFTFMITDIDDNDDFWSIYVEILDGTVSLLTDDEYNPTDLWDSDLWQEEYWWEIQSELDDIIIDILKPLKPKEIDLEIHHNLR